MSNDAKRPQESSDSSEETSSSEEVQQTQVKEQATKNQEKTNDQSNTEPKQKVHKRSGLSRTKTGLAENQTKVRKHGAELLSTESRLFNVLLVLFEIAIIVIYAVWMDYENSEAEASSSLRIYGYFRDINIMIFFGFGLLMTFLRRYGYSAIGYTLLISAMVAQWSIPIQGIAESHGDHLKITMFELTNSLFCAAAVMISFGAVLGKVSPVQMLILGFFEPVFYWINIYVTIVVLKVVDVGGGMTIHTFGAYYGLAITWFLTSQETRSHKDNAASYNSDIFSLVGTLFLWIMWPSFNAAIAPTAVGEIRAITNTFLSITSSTISSFMVSRMLSEHKFEIVHIQNSTLAGGVAMGVAAHLNLSPAGAIGTGFVTGCLSVWGYKYLTPLLSSRFRIQDICGVHNLHGMPGVLSCLVGIFAALRAGLDPSGLYPTDFDTLFPRGDKQVGYQVAGLFITLGIAIFSGIFTGMLMKLAHRVNPITKKDYFHDRTFWHLPSDYEYVFDVQEQSAPIVMEKQDDIELV